MSIDNQNTPATEAAITEATNALIAKACLKHNISPDQLPQETRDDAARYAREQVEANQRNQSNEYFHLYQQEKSRRELAEKQIVTVRENRTTKADDRVVTTMERCRDLMGRATWFQLSRDQKVAALGVEPSSVDMVQLRTLFGKHTDTALAVDFAKTSPFRYRQLREVAKALDVTGK